METIRCTVRFVTPAFLGGADQSAQWRTPPVKALLRQWWRVVWAAGGTRLDPELLKNDEARLFGAAADDRAGSSRASRVRLHMDWRGGDLVEPRSWQARTGKVPHREAEKAHCQVDAALYLGYGPLDFDRDAGNRLKRPSAIAAGDGRSLRIHVPGDGIEQEIRNALRLAHAFGGLGGRSRNGWGSLHFERGGLGGEELEGFLNPANAEARDWVRAFSRPWIDALDTDWCHAVGTDDKGLLVWRTQAMDKWEQVLRRLAEVKVAFRTKLDVKGPGFTERHAVAYPVTNHNLPGGRDKRLANQILFKVLKAGERYVGVVAHLPHGVPEALWRPGDEDAFLALQQRAWQTVHQVLDKNLTRLG